MTALRLATRRSELALAQSRQIAELVHRVTARSVELVPVVSQGDTDTAPLRQIGGTGVFVVAVRQTLLSDAADLAVHSLKDLPTAPAPGLAAPVVPTRADPRDALVAASARSFADLPRGARVGTGSPRRSAQLLALRPDLTIVDIRGNVDTRLGFVAAGQLDAVVLAVAGLQRLGRDDRITAIFDPGELLPAPGQGALAIEHRAGDEALADGLSVLDHRASHAAVTAERELLHALEAGCTAPVGAHATVTGATLTLSVVVSAADGSDQLRATVAGAAADAAALGREAAADVLARGAARLVGGSA